MSASFFDSGLTVAPSKRASIYFVPAKYTAATDYLRRGPQRRPSLPASRLAQSRAKLLDF
jgi:hypothetical protein